MTILKFYFNLLKVYSYIYRYIRVIIRSCIKERVELFLYLSAFCDNFLLIMYDETLA
jgi:hypothetical protein